MPSFSVAKWLRDNSGEFNDQKGIIYYHVNSGYCTFDYYYSHNIDAATLKNTMQSETKSDADIKRAICEPIPSTQQNAFHYVLSSQIYQNRAADQLAILPSKIDNTFGIYTATSWRDCSCAGCSKIASTAKADLDLRIKHHSDAIANGTIKTVSQHISDQLPLIFNTILTPFTNDPESFTQAITAHDKSGNTPLNYAYSSPENKNSLTVLQQHIKQLPEETKERIGLTKGNQEQTIFHDIACANTLSDFEKLEDYFSHNIFKLALRSPDKNKNSVLHYACSTNEDAMNKINYICKKLEMAKKEEKQPSPTLIYAFHKNLKDENPLHLAAKHKEDILTPLCNVLPPDLLRAKNKEKDKSGLTPLHYAIQSNNVDKIRGLLQRMTDTEKKEIVSIQDNSGLSSLHHACKYGSPIVLEEILKNLPSQELNTLLEKNKNTFKRLVSNNPRLNERDYTGLISKYDCCFNVYRYFIKKGLHPVKPDASTIERLNDFKDSLTSIEKEEPLPDNDAKFAKGIWSHQYLDEKASLKFASPASVKNFKRFLFTENNPIAQKLLGLQTQAKPQELYYGETAPSTSYLLPMK